MFTSQILASQVQVLRYSTKAQIWLGLRFVPFPGPSISGNQVLGKCALPTWGEGGSYRPPPIPAPGFPGCAVGNRLSCTVCLFWGADLWLQPSQRMSSVQNPRKSWLATGSLLAVW